MGRPFFFAADCEVVYVTRRLRSLRIGPIRGQRVKWRSFANYERRYEWRGKIERKVITVPTPQITPTSRHKNRPLAERPQYCLDRLVLRSLPVAAPCRK
jgi:hypothetical protein